ncbi:hypothetical protein JMUB7551_28660 [Staphylococcus aureus]
MCIRDRNYVDQYTNVRGSFEQVAFAKRKNATTDKTAYKMEVTLGNDTYCLLYTSPSPRDTERSRMPSSA